MALIKILKIDGKPVTDTYWNLSDKTYNKILSVLGEPKRKFEDTFSAETVVLEKFFNKNIPLGRNGTAKLS